MSLSPLTTPDVLRRTHARSLTAANKIARTLPLSASPDSERDIPLPPLYLPAPEPLVPKLLQNGLDDYAAQCVSKLVLDWVDRLRCSIEADYARRMHRIRSQPLALANPAFLHRLLVVFTTLYNTFLHRWQTHILLKVAPKLAKARAFIGNALSSDAKEHGKRPFNQGAVPILEHFFESNAFPSRLEKYDLAAKCAMDYRQIHVWFQNRRSRSRKEGKVLKKIEPRDKVLHELEQAMVRTLLPLEEGEDEDYKTSSDEHDVSCRIPVASYCHGTDLPISRACPRKSPVVAPLLQTLSIWQLLHMPIHLLGPQHVPTIPFL
ncbi:hypothetical protein BV20DRAFT_933444 [Pilatotrama ljubarskyi]|nr:hypothetical protein BV20DRAFT_933444 [Pilatotrama ljubarskyi]